MQTPTPPTAATYNGHTLEQLESKIQHMHPAHREQYTKNAARVIQCLETGFNLNEVESLKYSNFLLIRLYLTDHATT